MYIGMIGHMEKINKHNNYSLNFSLVDQISSFQRFCGPAFTLTGTGGIIEFIESRVYACVDNYDSKMAIQNL